MNDKRYAVWVSVSGGVTGPRAAFLKGEGGKPKVYDHEAEATEAAATYRKEMNRHSCGAIFNAWVMELSHE